MKEEKIESLKNKTVDNEYKPRKWLIVILIIITCIVAILLATNLVKSYNEAVQKGRESYLKAKEEERLREEAEEKEKEELRKKSAAQSFNRTFENRLGTNYPSTIFWVLDDVIKNNKTNPERLITVSMGNTVTTDPEAIKNLKKSFEEWHKYEVSCNYGEDGYINKIIIEY